jgi:hypothetical protein
MNDLLAILTFVAEAIWRVWPAFLLSVLVGVLIRALKLDGTIRRMFSAREGTAIVLATAIGAFSPFCSCTVIPVVSGLLLSGVPLAPVMAFWIASPTMDPEIFALSVATLGWPLALLRLAATLLLSLGAGVVTLVLTRNGVLGHGSLLRPSSVAMCCTSAPVPLRYTRQPIMLAANGVLMPLELTGTLGMTTPVAPATCTAASCAATTTPSMGTSESWWSPLVRQLRELHWPQIGREVADQSWRLGRWLLLAFVLEALIIRYVPQAAIIALLGHDNPLAIPLAALIGVPLYLSNISALPIVAGLLTQGMQPGAAIAFLIAGPVTTIPAMTAVWGVVQHRVFALYLGFGLIGAMLFGGLAALVLQY